MTERWIWQRLGGHDRPVQVTCWGRRAAHYPHDHDFLEITVITGGRGGHRCADGDMALVPGTILLLGPGVWHEYRDGRDLAGLDCCVQPGLLHRELAWLVDDPLISALLWGGRRGRGLVALHLSPEALTRTVAHLEAIRALADQPAARTRADHLGRLVLALSELARALASTGGTVTENGERHPAVSAALRALADGLAEEWTMERLAARTGLAADRLGRLFRAAVGEPPMAYLNRLRAERAASLLLRSDLPVSEIGAAVGWIDPNYCARRFRDRFACSPRDYRARFKLPPELC